MNPTQEGAAGTRTWTFRGFRWLVLSLAITLASNLLLLGINAGMLRFPANGSASVVVPWEVWMALLGAGVLAGVLGFWRVRQGRLEHGAGHRTNVARGSVSFIGGTASGVAYLATGLILGFVSLPGTYVSTSGTTITVSLALGDALRLTHRAAPAFITAFAGLFLLWTMWQLGPGWVRWVGLGALLAGLVAAVAGPLAYYLPISESAYLALQVLPAVSTGLWLVAYVRVIMHLRGSPSDATATALAT